MASMVVQMVKNLPEMLETWVQCLGQENPWEKGIATLSSFLSFFFFFFNTPVFLPGKFHGQRRLVGCYLWGCKDSDISEQLTLSL